MIIQFIKLDNGENYLKRYFCVKKREQCEYYLNRKDLIGVCVENCGFGGNMCAGDLEEPEIAEVDPSLMFRNWKRKKFC